MATTSGCHEAAQQPRSRTLIRAASICAAICGHRSPRRSRFAAFEPARLNDPATRALMMRITKELDPEVDAAFPRRRSARVTVTLNDGRHFVHLQPDRKGDPELPLFDADLGGKLLELASPVIGGAEARALLARLWALNASGLTP